MRIAGFGHEMDRVENGQCPFCDARPRPWHFRDALSYREFQISGMCQACQDETFVDDERPEDEEPCPCL